MRRHCVLGLALISVLSFCPSILTAQGAKASVSGRVTDPSGAVVPHAKMQLRALGTGAVLRTTTNSDGLYSFPNLLSGGYDLLVSARGFRDFKQSGITLNINQVARLDISLQLGSAVQTVEVNANPSPLNFENAVQKGTITPETLESLPLVLNGQTRTVVSFVTLEPGVTSGGGDNRNGFDAKINGGMQETDEAVLDGVSMIDGSDSQDGIGLAVTGHPVSPDAVSEFSEITSNYQPQYGATQTGVFTAVTKSGTNQYHGSAYEYNRNTSLNAREWGIPNRPPNIQNDFGASIGGPVKIPWLAWTQRKKTYFFVNYEGYRERGGAISPILSLPTMQEREGDFSDWKDSSGNLIPIYDPATTRPNPNYSAGLPVGPGNLPVIRDQFMGCNGNTPNVICPADPRLQSSLAKQWLQFLPTPTFTNKILQNYVVPVPVPTTVNGDTTLFDTRVDGYIGNNDHVSVEVHYYGSFLTAPSQLPKQISFDGYRAPNYGFLDRLNYDHTFRPNLLNNLNFGYNDILSDSRCTDAPYASVLPQIPGVFDHKTPPALSFDDFTGFGCNGYFNQARPAYVVNDLLSWVKGRHLFKFGGEYRAEEMNNTGVSNDSGSFYFSRLNTGLLGETSGNGFASFLLGYVATGSSFFPTVASNYPRQKYYALFAGDTWKMTPKLTFDYGIRWDVSPPAVDKYNNLSFLDPNGPNPGADNLPGRLAFSGTKWGAASFGRTVPESTSYRSFGPRIGLAYAVTPKTVVRAGYGIFYSQLLYPGWNGGVLGGQDGFNTNALFQSTNGGITPAFLLQSGLPQNFAHPPFINSAFDNGQFVGLYRDPTSGHLPYTQQWNLTVERQFTNNFYISAGYVANKGTHLVSFNAPINTLNPNLLSTGPALYDQFQPGQTTLDGVTIPYSGWVQQMQACPPTVAQALLRYPQYCGTLQATNEQAGNSSFQSLQVKAEKRFSGGLWFQTSYTLEKWVANTWDLQGASGRG
ncbi:MAG TPA: TonB-dependent receptor, partial [Terriglobia bacterium]|nr:TonB-dependent receptor [Terriglobia bacterium]